MSFIWKINSVQFSYSVVSNSLQPHGLQHARPPCPSPTPRVYPNSYPLSQRCHPIISSSVVPFSFCLQSFPAPGLFKWVSSLHQVAKVFGVSASTSVLPMNTQDWSPLGWTAWISLQSSNFLQIIGWNYIISGMGICISLLSLLSICYLKKAN